MQININQFNQILGKQLSRDEIEAYQIQSLALGGLINSAVFENEFENNKFLIDEKIIAKITKERIPNLYDNNNKIDEVALNSFLTQQRLKINDLVNIINFEARDNVFNNLFFSITLPNKLTNKIKSYEKHQRNIEYLKLNLDQIKLDKDVTNINKNDKFILDYFELNKNNYKSNEARDISFILIDKNLYKDQFMPSNQRVENYFLENKKLFLESEQRDFIQFNFKIESDANEFLNKIKGLKQENIINLAEDNRIKFNKFKNLSKNEVLADLSDEIFNLNKGALSKVIKSPLAYHIIIVTEIIPEKQKKFNDVIEEIQTTILSSELNNFFNELKTDINNQIISGSSLGEISSMNNIEVQNLKNITQEGLNNNEETDPNKLIINEIIDKGFNSNKDFVTDLIDYDENLSFVLNVDTIYLPEILDFNNIYEKVITDWLYENKKNLVKENYNQNIENQNYLNELSDLYSAKIVNKLINTEDLEIPRNLSNKIFVQNINKPILYFENNDFYIAKVNKIIIDKNLNFENDKISLNDVLKNAFGNEIIKSKKISTNDSLLDALLSQY